VSAMVSAFSWPTVRSSAAALRATLRLNVAAIGNARAGREDMPTWLWIVLIVLLVLALTGGIGYRRR
jgi:hypothetical protein